MKSSFIFPEPPAHVLEIGHAAKYSHAVTYGQRLRLERLLLSLKFQIIMSGFSLKEEAQRELDEEYKMRNEVRKLWLQNIKIGDPLIICRYEMTDEQMCEGKVSSLGEFITVTFEDKYKDHHFLGDGTDIQFSREIGEYSMDDAMFRLEERESYLGYKIADSSSTRLSDLDMPRKYLDTMNHLQLRIGDPKTNTMTINSQCYTVTGRIKGWCIVLLEDGSIGLFDE